MVPHERGGSGVVPVRTRHMDASSRDEQFVGGNMAYASDVDSIQPCQLQTDPMASFAATDSISRVLCVAADHEKQLKRDIRVLNSVLLSLASPSDDHQHNRHASISCHELRELSWSLYRRLSDIYIIKQKLRAARVRHATSDTASEMTALLFEFALWQRRLLFCNQFRRAQVIKKHPRSRQLVKGRHTHRVRSSADSDSPSQVHGARTEASCDSRSRHELQSLSLISSASAITPAAIESGAAASGDSESSTPYTVDTTADAVGTGLSVPPRSIQPLSTSPQPTAFTMCSGSGMAEPDALSADLDEADKKAEIETKIEAEIDTKTEAKIETKIEAEIETFFNFRSPTRQAADSLPTTSPFMDFLSDTGAKMSLRDKSHPPHVPSALARASCTCLLRVPPARASCTCVTLIPTILCHLAFVRSSPWT